MDLPLKSFGENIGGTEHLSQGSQHCSKLTRLVAYKTTSIEVIQFRNVNYILQTRMTKSDSILRKVQCQPLRPDPIEKAEYKFDISLSEYNVPSH